MSFPVLPGRLSISGFLSLAKAITRIHTHISHTHSQRNFNLLNETKNGRSTKAYEFRYEISESKERTTNDGIENEICETTVEIRCNKIAAYFFSLFIPTWNTCSVKHISVKWFHSRTKSRDSFLFLHFLYIYTEFNNSFPCRFQYRLPFKRLFVYILIRLVWCWKIGNEKNNKRFCHS